MAGLKIVSTIASPVFIIKLQLASLLYGHQIKYGKPMIDKYRSHESTFEKVQLGVYSPSKAIVYGLLTSVVLASFASMVGSVIFAFLMEPELGRESKSVDALANSIAFLTINVTLYTLIMYYAGTIVKNTLPQRKENLVPLFLR